MEKITPALVAALMLLIPGAALADHADGCDHGNSGKECREDPQPDKGKDCDAHGKEGKGGGENEDHCKAADVTGDDDDDDDDTATTTRKRARDEHLSQDTPGDTAVPGVPRLATTGTGGLALLGFGLIAVGCTIRKRAVL